MKEIIFLAAFMLALAFTMPLFAAFESSTVSGNFIVTDTETGLIWQGTYTDKGTWRGVLNYCENLTYAGYDDWRLPNKNELASLVNYTKYNPASDFPNMPSKGFCSSSTDVENTSWVWIVDFNSGSVDGYCNSKTVSCHVRCVRN